MKFKIGDLVTIDCLLEDTRSLWSDEMFPMELGIIKENELT